MKKLIIIFICLLLCGCKQVEEKHADISAINNFNYENIDEFDFDIHSQEYLLVRMSDLNVMYEKEADRKMYPASLTKLLTLDTVLNCVPDLSEKSSITYNQVQQLIIDDASLAYIQTDYEYTIKDLLYALVLPSGADAAVALENYFVNHGLDLVEQMNIQAKKLGCLDSNFVNTTGLHDDSHYTTLNDLFKIVMDVLSFEDGRKILETMHYVSNDNKHIFSSLMHIKEKSAIILGGKTGFTTESGQSVIVLFKANNRSYILEIANAMGNPYIEQYWHFEDCVEIIDNLY